MSFCACNAVESVLESRVVTTQGHAPYVRRRRQCEKCGKRFTTMEVQVKAGKGIKSYMALDTSMLQDLRRQSIQDVLGAIGELLKLK